jgi:predicted MFS family arabinose efflux permease
VTGGYALNLIAVPALAFVGSWQAAALLIVVERTGKAMRGPARDVLLSEATGEVGHGWGFGLHAAMDQTGAVLGPLLMVAAVAHWKGFGMAFLPLAVPALLALASIVVAHAYFPAKGVPPKAPVQHELPSVFWLYVAAAGLLASGFVDFPLLAYHVQERALVKSEAIPLLYAGAMAVVGASALLCGRLYDRFGIAVLAWGILISMFSLPLGFLGGSTGIVIAVACWGIGIGVQDASLRAGIAQVVSMNKRGTAFGVFNGVYGVAWFAGSVLMGWLYGRSLVLVVVFGMTAQLLAAIWFFWLRRPLRAEIAAAG